MPRWVQKGGERERELQAEFRGGGRAFIRGAERERVSQSEINWSSFLA